MEPSEGYRDRTALKLALVASILTLLSLSLMNYAYPEFVNDVLILGQIVLVFDGATILLLLVAVMFAVFDRVDWARTFLAIGIVALAISVLIHTIKMIDKLGQ